jgi:hypothetical protein
MTECKITPATKKQLSSTVSKLKKVLSKKIWKSCVVALTFANQVLSRFEDDPEIEDDAGKIKIRFNSIVDEWKSEIQNILSAANIGNYKEIPIVATGKVKEPKLLPDDEKPWLSILWNTIYNKSPVNGRAVLFHFNAQRLTDGDVSSEESPTTSLFLQKIEIDESFKEKLWDTIKRNHAAIAAALGVGGAGGITGATIGATIGALAIGIPSFGMAAGVGLVLGGLIGGGIGIGVGAVAGTVVKHVQSKREETTETAECESNDAADAENESKDAAENESKNATENESKDVAKNESKHAAENESKDPAENESKDPAENESKDVETAETEAATKTD